MFYRIPESLKGEIDALERLIVGFQSGTVDAATLKVHRVPFGIYEQRQDGTFMARVRCPGGMITPDQLKAVALLSDKYGNDEIHITTRQELQIHGLSVDRLVLLLRDLSKEGLSSRGGGGNTVRNIIVSPESGIDPEETFDVSPHACALTTRLIADPGSWLLPRKFKIAFSSSARDTGYARFNDVGFVARLKDGVRGFRVYVAGGMGSKPEVGHLLEDFVPERQVFAVAEAIKRLFSRYGNRKNRHAARLRFLWRELGEERFRSLYQEQLAELRTADRRLRISDFGLGIDEPSPECPDHSVPQSAIRNPQSAIGNPQLEVWKSRYVTPQKQGGLFSVLIPVLLGNVKTSSIIELAEFLRELGHDVVRLTTGQNLQLRNLRDDCLGETFDLMSRLFELSAAERFLGDSIACTGADTCKLGICLPRGALRAVLKRLRRSDLDLDRLSGCRLNLSGCPNSCGQHPLADLGFYGRAGRKSQFLYPEYNVVAGAVIGEEAPRFAEEVDRVSARDLPEFVHDLLARFLSKPARFQSFQHYLRTEGKQDIRELCERFRTIPDFEEDKNYYYDWGAKDQFGLVGKGGGECSAGLFDLIEVDLRRIRELRKPWLKGERETVDGESLWEIVLSASRMLLITRGVEATSEDSVFWGFERHFISTGLVDPRFSTVVDAARERRLDLLGGLAHEVHGFAEAIERLYRSMDNSLHFPGESDTVAVPGQVRPTGSYPGLSRSRLSAQLRKGQVRPGGNEDRRQAGSPAWRRGTDP